MSKQKGFSLIVLILSILIILITATIIAYVLRTKQEPSKTTTPQVEPSASHVSQDLQPLINDDQYDIEIKEIPGDKSKSNVFVTNKRTGEVNSWIAITDVYRNHNHNAEYHQGNLYLIRRTGGDSDYRNNPNWTDTLYRYSQGKEEQKLYSTPDLDFRVSDNEKYVAIKSQDRFVLLNENGSLIKDLGTKDFLLIPNADVGFAFRSAWSPNALWLANYLGPSIAGLIKINLPFYNIQKYNLSSLSINSLTESDLNTKRATIAYSNYPAFFDTEGTQDYEKSREKVTLIVYDLETKAQQVVATSITKSFRPEWINDSTLEYNHPNGEGRVSKQIF